MSRGSRDRLPPGVLEQLGAGLPGAMLNSALLDVMHRRAAARTPAHTLAQYRRDRFVAPSPVDQREAVEVDRALLRAADGFEAVELSPLAPLGVTSTMGPTDQNRVVSALRHTEVVSDPTNVLALECAHRLRETPTSDVHLTTSQRVVRAQPVPDRPGMTQHFRLFALASGGVERVDHGLTIDAVVRHVRTLLAALHRLEELGYAFGRRRVDLLAVERRAPLADRIAEALGPAVEVERKPLSHPYYSGGLRYMLWVADRDGGTRALADGGAFDWLAQLLSNRRAVYVASGLGAQLVPLMFRPA